MNEYEDLKKTSAIARAADRLADENAGEKPAPNDPGKTPNDPGKAPNDPGRTPNDPGKTPNDPGKTPNDPGKTPNDSGKTPGDPGKAPNDPGKTPNDPGETPVDPGKTEDKAARDGAAKAEDSDDSEVKGEPGSQKKAPDSATLAKNKAKKKRYRRKALILYILLGLCIAATIVCAVGLGLELYTARKSIKYYSDLSSEIEKHPRPAISPGVFISPEPEPGAPQESESPGTGRPAEEEPVAGEDTWVPYVDFDILGNRFPGIVAWIQLEGTLLDYPVMQGRDNAFYLSHLPDGTSNRAGSVFLDYRNSPDFTDRNSLIYGHMSRVGEMFGALKEYRNQAFYDAHPIINLYTAEHDYAIVLIAGYLVDSGVETPPMGFRDDADFERYIANLKRRSVFSSDVGANPDDRLVCLCTCAYDFTNARLVIVGKLVEVSWSANPYMQDTQ